MCISYIAKAVSCSIGPYSVPSFYDNLCELCRIFQYLVRSLGLLSIVGAYFDIKKENLSYTKYRRNHTLIIFHLKATGKAANVITTFVNKEFITTQNKSATNLRDGLEIIST